MLVRPFLDRRIEGRMRENNGARGCDRPSDVVVVPVPQLHAKAHVFEVVLVGIGELQQRVHVEVKLRGAAPKVTALGMQLL
jgi:hypothetical protein